MARKLFDTNTSGPISPLIDVVVNALAAMFVILMVFLAVARPVEEEPLKFLTEVEPPSAILGQSYVFTFPVTDGVGARHFTLLQGELTTLNLDFDAVTGTIHGVPKVEQATGNSGRVDFPIEVKLEVEVTDDSGTDNREATFKLESGAIPYSETPLKIVRETKVLPLGRVGVTYETVFGALGGVEPYKWKLVEDGNLPAGLDFDETVGRLSGIPSEAGSFSFEVKVEHTYGSFVYKDNPHSWSAGEDQQAYQLEVLGGLRHSLHLPLGRVGEPYFACVQTSVRLPGDLVNWTAAVDGLAASDEGSLRGTPSKPGVFKISYQIQNGQNLLGTGEGDLRILPRRPQPSVGAVVFQAWVGEPVGDLIPYRGLHEPVTLTALAPFPEGLQIDNDRIVGTPAKTGLVKVPIRAEDALGNVANGEVTIRIGPRKTPLTIDIPETLDLVVRRPVYWRPTASGGEGHYDWKLQGQLPPNFKSQNGAIDGVLKAPGTWSVTASVRDSITGETASQPISLRGIYAEETPPKLLTMSIPNALVGSPFEFAFAVSGGVGEPQFDLRGDLPNGLKFTETGLSGIPTDAGTSVFNVTVRDEENQKDGPKEFKLLVEVMDRSQPRVVTSALPPAVHGHQYTQFFSAEGGIGKYTWVIRGNLPSGLRFTNQGIEGTVAPQAQGSWPITASVRDETGQGSSKSLTLEVVAR